MAAQSTVGPTPLKCSESGISGWRVPPTLPCSHGAWHSLVMAIPLLCAQQGALLLSPESPGWAAPSSSWPGA